MSTDETDATIGRLHREHKDAVAKRLHIVERTKQIADALMKLASAIDRTPDFAEVCRDSILQQYLDLSKIASLVIEEQELSAKIRDYQERLTAFGYSVCS